jgi:hypothetical protein
MPDALYQRLLAHSGIKSFELHVFLSDSRVPDCAAWQSEIDRLGFPTVLDAAFDVRGDVGYFNATYNAHPTGFNFALSPASNILSLYPHIAARIGERGKSAAFIWSGDLPEGCAALSAAAGLAKVADGVWFYPADSSLQGADEAVDTARAALRTFAKFD